MKNANTLAILAAATLAGCQTVSHVGEMAHTRASHVGALLHSGKSTPSLAMKALVFKSNASAVLVNVPAGLPPTQEQINVAGAGGTITLAGSTNFNFSKPLQLLPNQTIVGGTQIAVKSVADTTTLPGYSIPTPQYSFSTETVLNFPGGVLFRPADGVTIRNITATTSLLDYNANLNGLSVKQCRFNMLSTQAGKATAIQSSNGGWYNTEIADCVFQDPNHIVDSFVYFYDLSGHVHNLAFQGANDSLHITGTSAATNVLIEQMYSADNAANAVEFQNSGVGVAIKDCWQDTPRYSQNPVPGTNGECRLLGFSCPNDRGSGLTIDGLVVLANNQPNMTWRQRLAIELAQPGDMIRHVYANGVRKAVASNNAQTSGTVSDCYFESDLPEVSDTNGTFPNGNPKISYTNVADVTVKQKLLARGRPGAMFVIAPLGTITPTNNTPTVTPVATTPATLPSGPVTWASELAYAAIANGWGPVEKDRSNGEQSAGDGGPLTLNGVTYTKGFGCHASSQVDLPLNGGFTAFKCDIGLDDEVGANGSLMFSVLADGTKVFDSGLMTGGSARKSINIDVTGVKKLSLVVTSPTADNGFDHADWAGAHLIPAIPSSDNTVIAALQQQLAAAKVTIDALNAKVADLTASNATLIAKVKAAIGL